MLVRVSAGVVLGLLVRRFGGSLHILSDDVVDCGLNHAVGLVEGLLIFRTPGSGRPAR